MADAGRRVTGGEDDGLAIGAEAGFGGVDGIAVAEREADGLRAPGADVSGEPDDMVAGAVGEGAAVGAEDDGGGVGGAGELWVKGAAGADGQFLVGVGGEVVEDEFPLVVADGREDELVAVGGEGDGALFGVREGGQVGEAVVVDFPDMESGGGGGGDVGGVGGAGESDLGGGAERVEFREVFGSVGAMGGLVFQLERDGGCLVDGLGDDVGVGGGRVDELVATGGEEDGGAAEEGVVGGVTGGGGQTIGAPGVGPLAGRVRGDERHGAVVGHAGRHPVVAALGGALGHDAVRERLGNVGGQAGADKQQHG